MHLTNLMISFIIVYPVNNSIQQNISELEYNDNDKLLDEHFKRSLGVDYETLFKKKPAISDSKSSTTTNIKTKIFSKTN